MKNQTAEIVSSDDSVDYSDSDGDMFLNLAPSNQKKSSQNSNNQQHSMLAKMKRLIGDAYINNTTQNNTKNSVKTKNTKITKIDLVKAFNPEQDSYASQNDDIIENSERQRSRDKTEKKRSIKNTQDSSDQRIHSAANLSIQKQNTKQNLKSAINQSNNENLNDSKDTQKHSNKFNKFAQIQKQLLIPIDELPILQKSIQEEKQEKRAKKRLDRMMEKKYKQYKVGKVKDQTSNCVFNGIEDYFM